MNNKCSKSRCLSAASVYPTPFKGKNPLGFTLIEMLLVIAIVGTLCGIAIPAYTGYREKIDCQKGIADIVDIGLCIDKFYAENNSYPVNLAETGKAGLVDPWDQPYQYMRHPTAKPKKLWSIHPINTDYDLWSIGKDGTTKQTVNSKPSWDDIIRAFDGAYIGLAKDLSNK